MAEPYTDEQARTLLSINAADPSGDCMAFATIRRLMAERDEARRVARQLAAVADICQRPDCTQCTPEDHKARETLARALAYPEVEP